MSISILFWVIMLIWLLFGFWSNWPNYKAVGGGIIVWVLLALLGWAVFGAAIHR